MSLDFIAIISMTCNHYRRHEAKASAMAHRPRSHFYLYATIGAHHFSAMMRAWPFSMIFSLARHASTPLGEMKGYIIKWLAWLDGLHQKSAADDAALRGVCSGYYYASQIRFLSGMRSINIRRQ